MVLLEERLAMDSAFPPGAYPSMTTGALRAAVEAAPMAPASMVFELARRDAVAAGDWSRSTPGERLRHVRAGGSLFRAGESL